MKNPELLFLIPLAYVIGFLQGEKISDLNHDAKLIWRRNWGN